jgi:6-phosphogluconolactonase
MGGEPDTVSPNVEPPVGGTANAGSGGTPSPSSSGGDGGTAGAQASGGGGTGGGGAPHVPTGTPIVIVGGYDYGSSSYPLRTFDLDKATGALTQRGNDVDAGPNPTYLALAPSGGFLYVANETDAAEGGLSAVQIAPDGALTFINHQTGSDGGFAHVAVDPSGRFAFGASYNGGSVSVFPIEADGSLGDEVETRDFGDGAQSHFIGFDPSGQFVFVPNKGNDAVAQLLLGEDGSLTDNAPPEVASPQGAGPRHFALHPSGAFAFVLNELGSSMTPFQLADDGTLSAGTTVSTLPPDFNGQNSGAHVEVSPDGRFVYGSNRGHDSIAVFAIDEGSGALTLVEHEPTLGDTPRDFEMDPEGDVLIVANQDTTSLVVFAIADDGTLSPLGEAQGAPPSPAAVQLVYLAE